MLLVLAVFNMAQYWIIINSFCFKGISLFHIKIPLCHRKSIFILKNRWGLRFGVFYHDVKSHKHKVKFSPPPSATSRSWGGVCEGSALLRVLGSRWLIFIFMGCTLGD